MSDQGITEPSTTPETRAPRKVMPWVIAGVAAVLVVGAAIIIPVSIAQHQADEKAKAEAAAQEKAAAAEKARLAQFSTALKSCGIKANNIIIHDSGESIELSRVTKYDGMSYNDLTCFLAGLDAPDTIEAKIGQTRALDGRQSDDWEGFDIEWSYHPDSGASIIIEHAD